MKAIFVDTSGWFALAARHDRDHPKALKFFQGSRSPLLTTDYIVDETVTLFQARLNHSAAIRFLDSIQASTRLSLIFLTRKNVEAAIKLFRERPDKGWSLTDCTSFTIMERMRINTAFAFDDDFKQAGFNNVPG